MKERENEESETAIKHKFTTFVSRGTKGVNEEGKKLRKWKRKRDS